MPNDSPSGHNRENNGARTPVDRRRIREEIAPALQLAHYLTASGDLRGAWETYRCLIRMVASESTVEPVQASLCALLEEGATQVNLEAQVASFRQRLDEIAGPWDPSPASTNARVWIQQAISLGAPAYNAGDQRGCYEVYSATARLLLTLLSEDADGPAVKSKLEEVLRRCATMADVDTQAWAMRHTFDALLTPPAEGTPEIRAILQHAIVLGAPVYNGGDHDGCYAIYAAVARLIVTTFAGAEQARELLQEALDQCAELEDPNQQAWTMRRAFDRLLAGE